MFSLSHDKYIKGYTLFATKLILNELRNQVFNSLSSSVELSSIEKKY